MPALILPAANRPRLLSSFWLVVSLFLGLLLSATFSPLFSLGWLFLAVSSTAALFLPVWRKPELASLPYRAWNKMARGFGYYGRLLVLGIIFYVIFLAVGRTGSHLKLQRPEDREESQWIKRDTLSPDAYHVQHSLPGEESFRSWISAFSSWTLRSGNVWALFLLPFLVLLSWLDTEQEENFPSGIYTLF
jgi:hypothetical protein